MSRRFMIPNLRIPARRLPNRCILCGRVIPDGYSICATCRARMNPRRRF